MAARASNIRTRRIECDVAVIGAGPAGMAAAVSSSESGAEQVVLIERDLFLGGILQQCIHNGFGLHIFGEDLTGPEYAHRFIRKLAERPVRCLTRTMVIGLDADKNILAVSETDGLTNITPGAVVLAMGCRERTRGAIGLPGTRPSGIMTAGTAQRFINIDGILPGKEIVILGSGDIGMIMARRLHLEGCSVKAVVELNSSIGGLSRNLVQCIQDFKIPLYLGHTITDIHGDQRLESVDIAPVATGRSGSLPKSGAFCVKCDTLLLSVGLIPENELSRQAGISIDPITSGPLVDQNLQTTTAGIFAAGNAVQVFDLVDHVSFCGMKAGLAAAMYTKGKLDNEERVTILPGEGIRCVIPQRITGGGGGEIDFYLRAADIGRKMTLKLQNERKEVLLKKKFSIVRPPEMIKVTVRNGDFTSSGACTFSLQGENR